MDQTTQVRRAARAVARADESLVIARVRLGIAIREAIQAEVPVAELAAATGLTPGRIYQIRDGRR